MNVRLNRRSEELLNQQLAHGRFRSPEDVIAHALEVLATPKGSSRTEARERSPEQFAAFLDDLVKYSDKIPAMPGETFSREMIYQEHA